MKIRKPVPHLLGWKLFLSHILIVVVGSLVLVVTSRIQAPNAFLHHMEHMRILLGPDNAMAEDLRRNFLAASNEILLISGVVASVAAVLASSFIAWRIVSPIRSLMEASKRIADGNYSDRIQTKWNDELGELALSFNQMAEILEGTERRRTELIGNLAHELKTPLTGIRSMMEGLIDGVLSPDTETFLDVQRETSRLQRLTEELSQLSKAEAGIIQLDLEQTNPAELIRRTVSRLESQFEDKGVQLVVEVSHNLPHIRMDSERVLQILINLLGNALQYTNQGGVVRLKCSLLNSHLRFSIQDTGIGIAPEHLPHLFDRFYRVDSSRARAHGGSGIGLTIAIHLARAHGGTITADSRGPGFGSTFTLTLPIDSDS
ncbi:hypothetical protein B4O97_12230 [Marispirochaeta aestuarii]|uniref:histidine kinase n=1 Tax=Marispirochaeta aestuarii TaxID=1963862 RepID=A0A1Y1RWV6_9SPIO|nr:HAMP domain-containing sensor histidine kinase [Marispirochaeta aestuarii]ORC34704.1 hypothetical protein B4O97_12230 [Marispirochaeta aestuarii]